jgi:tRNA(fMet)-specific endonuclease VapC
MQYMLDTDTCVYLSRKSSPKVLARVRRYSPGDLVISAVTYGELRFGAEKGVHPETGLKILDEFTDAVPVVALGKPVGEFYGKLRLYLQRKGQIIGNNDLWIAAHCLQLGLTLVTNNEREFSRIPNLAIENWTH